MQEILEKGKAYEKKQQDESNLRGDERFELYKKKLEAEGKMIPEDTKALFKQFKET